MPIDKPTEELTTPASAPESIRGRPALIAVFPTLRALPLPVPNEEIGREWLEQHGVVDPKVSRAHLMFDRAGGGLHMRDVGSSNGTWIDGVPLLKQEPVPVHDGAVIRAGRSIYIYRESLIGSDTPSAPLGLLVAPFGLERVRLQLDHVLSRTPSNVLIQGETGTGKELIAAEIATRVQRAKRYVAVNIAGIAPTVFESQMFGHERGAFTGADHASEGIFLSHDRGAVFLDEIGDLALDQQARLLRLLDNREVLPVGAKAPRTVDVVIIAATHRNLEQMVAEGKFRQDLLARLSAARILLPPLRERREDILAIAIETIGKRGHRYDAAEVEPEAVERLLLHDWPMNVRELAATVDQIAAFVPPPKLTRWAVDKVLGDRPETSRTVTSAEIDSALERTNGNQSEAARILGTSYGRVQRHCQAKKKSRRPS